MCVHKKSVRQEEKNCPDGIVKNIMGMLMLMPWLLCELKRRVYTFKHVYTVVEARRGKIRVHGLNHR